MEFPIKISGKVVPGFGRGSKELGFPTANLDVNIENCEDGVFYGYAWLSQIHQYESNKITTKYKEKMVMSIGNNPQYNNLNKSYEVHIIKENLKDFYGETLHIEIIGKIREMKKFENIEELIKAIYSDIEYANLHLY